MKLLTLPAASAAAVLAATLFTSVQATPPPASEMEPLILRVAPERDLIYRRGPREVVVQVEVEARRPERRQHTPLNVAVVLDRSGSMEGAKLEKARQAAAAALDKMEDDDVISVVIYDDRAEVLLPPQKVGSRSHREQLKRQIERIKAGGSTALYAGVQLGAEQVREHLRDERVNRVILLSDGLANQGPSSPHQLAELGRKLGGEGLSVTTIGLGDDFNEDLMTGLAEASHANYYYVKDAEKLPGIFAEELGAAGSRMAADVIIRFEVPEGVCLEGILGHPEIECRTHSAEIKLPELFGAEHRIYHLQCVVEGEAPKSLAVARVALAYRDAESRATRNQAGSATVRFTDKKELSEESVKDDVAQNVAVVQNRLDKAAAVKLADEGRAQEAEELLRKRAAANAAAPMKQQLPQMSQENADLERFADELSSQGNFGKGMRKEVQWQNYQDRNQKR